MIGQKTLVNQTIEATRLLSSKGSVSAPWVANIISTAHRSPKTNWSYSFSLALRLKAMANVSAGSHHVYAHDPVAGGVAAPPWPCSR
jgi:hypothetical protein